MTNDCNVLATEASVELIPIGMGIEDHVSAALEATDRKRLKSALLHACIAIDATARKLHPEIEGVGKRYTTCLREYFWAIEPMIGAGMNLTDTHFPQVNIPKVPNPDFADIVYTIFRCYGAHGDMVPIDFALTRSNAGRYHWLFMDRKIHMPDLVIFALLGVTVFSKANADVRTDGEYVLTLGKHVFRINEWWGREGDFRPIADRYNQTRVAIKGLENIVPEGPDGPKVARAIVQQPYAV